jgi:hypothetical protein
MGGLLGNSWRDSLCFPCRIQVWVWKTGKYSGGAGVKSMVWDLARMDGLKLLLLLDCMITFAGVMWVTRKMKRENDGNGSY